MELEVGMEMELRMGMGMGREIGSIMESHSKKMTVKSHHHHLASKAKHIACRAIHPMTFNPLQLAGTGL